MKIFRLFQPRNSLFWLMLVLNALSALLGWVTHTFPLGFAVSLLVTGFALGNAALGSWLIFRLLNS